MRLHFRIQEDSGIYYAGIWQKLILVYRNRYKRRKREDVMKVAVPRKEMRSFFWNYINLLERQMVMQKSRMIAVILLQLFIQIGIRK